MLYPIHMFISLLVLWTVPSYGFPSQSQAGDVVTTGQTKSCCYPDQFTTKGVVIYGTGNREHFTIYVDFKKMKVVRSTEAYTELYNLRDNVGYHIISDTNCVITGVDNFIPCPLGTDPELLQRYRARDSYDKREHWVNKWLSSAKIDPYEVDDTTNSTQRKPFRIYHTDDETCRVEKIEIFTADGSLNIVMLTHFRIGVDDPTVFDINISACVT